MNESGANFPMASTRMLSVSWCISCPATTRGVSPAMREWLQVLNCAGDADDLFVSPKRGRIYRDAARVFLDVFTHARQLSSARSTTDGRRRAHFLLRSVGWTGCSGGAWQHRWSLLPCGFIAGALILSTPKELRNANEARDSRCALPASFTCAIVAGMAVAVGSTSRLHTGHSTARFAVADPQEWKSSWSRREFCAKTQAHR